MKRTVFLIFLIPIMVFSKNENLENSSSPYIKKYIESDIHWKEYNRKLFNEAKKEDKLIYISIGKNNCDWCEKQDELTIENPEVARILNLYYTSIKIDLEQSPSLSQKYIDISKIINSSTIDIPLNVILASNGDIIYMKNYIGLDGKEGMLSILPQLSRKMDNVEFRKKIKENNNKIEEVLNKSFSAKSGKNITDIAIINAFSKRAEKTFDSNSYGMIEKSNKKYINKNILMTILEINNKNPKEKMSWILNSSANAIVSNGIVDQVEGGFFSYSDQFWKISSFSKSLKSTADAISFLSTYYNIKNEKYYKDAVVSSINYLSNNFKDESGFYYTKTISNIKLEEDKNKYFLYYKDEFSGEVNYNNMIFVNRIVPQVEKDKLLKIRKQERASYKPELDKRIFFSENVRYAISLIKSKNLSNIGYKEGVRLAKSLIGLKDKKNNIPYLILENKSQKFYYLEDYVLYTKLLITMYNETLEVDYLNKANSFLSVLEKKFFKKNVWSSKSGEEVIKSNLFSNEDSTSPLSILFSIYNELGILTNNINYMLKAKDIISKNMFDILYSPLKNSLIVKWISIKNNNPKLITSSRQNILKIKDLFSDKYFYRVDNNIDYYIVSTTTKKIFQANSIKELEKKENDLISKVKDDKFILILE